MRSSGIFSIETLLIVCATPLSRSSKSAAVRPPTGRLPDLTATWIVTASVRDRKIWSCRAGTTTTPAGRGRRGAHRAGVAADFAGARSMARTASMRGYQKRQSAA